MRLIDLTLEVALTQKALASRAVRVAGEGGAYNAVVHDFVHDGMVWLIAQWDPQGGRP